MSAERFHRILTSQLRELKETLEVEHDREMSRLQQQVARLEGQLGRLKAGPGDEAITPEAPPNVDALPPAVAPRPLMHRTSSPCVRLTAWDSLSAATSVPSAGVPPVQTATIDIQHLEDAVADASEVASSEPASADDGKKVTIAEEEQVSRAPSLRSQRCAKRSSTAPVTTQVLPTLLASRRLSLLVPTRSATDAVSEVTDEAGAEPTTHEVVRTTSRRPSNASYISFRGVFPDGRPSVMTQSSNESDGAAFKVLDVWAESQWRKSRRMVCNLLATDLDSADESADIGQPGPAHRSALVSNLFDDEGALVNNMKGLRREDRFRCLRRCMIQPSSIKHLAWESIGLILIMHDVVVVPLDLFELPEHAFMVGISWLIRLFWTIDIFLSFLTGRLDSQGRVVLGPMQVAKRYARTWLVLDLTCIGIDWATIMPGERTGALRGARLLRAVKLLRLVKAQMIKDSIAEHMLSEQFILIANIAKSITMLLVVAHVVACLWYFVGLNGHEMACGSAGWVTAKSLGHSEFVVRYAWSFHWSLGLFAGETSYPPENKCERYFAIGTLFVFFISSCLFVSSITTSMTRLQIIASKQASQMSALRRYLGAHSIRPSLAVRVQRNAQHAFTEQRRSAPEESVDLLSLVSEPLRAELHFEVHAPVLMAHPFFDVYHTVNAMGVQKLCHTAVAHLTLSRGDVVFSDLETPALPRMFFVISGRLLYLKQTSAEPLPENSLPSKAISGKAALAKQQDRYVSTATPDSSVASSSFASPNVEGGQWASEASLWTRWIHRGTFKAVSECTLLALDAAKFQQIISPFPTHHAHLYASAFVELLNVLDSSSLTDLRIVDQEDLVACAFPEMMMEDDRTSHASWTNTSMPRLSTRFRAQKTKSRIWQ